MTVFAGGLPSSPGSAVLILYGAIPLPGSRHLFEQGRIFE